MNIVIITYPWAPHVAALESVARELVSAGHSVEVRNADAYRPNGIRTIPSIIVDGVVLDVETVDDLALERIINTKPPTPGVPEPDARDVLIAALVAKIGAPTEKELTAARASLMPKSAAVEKLEP